MAEESHPAEAGLTQASASESFEALAKKDESKAKDTHPVYEVGFHVVSTVEEAGVGEVVEKIRAVLAKANAEILKEQFPQKMTLAYSIERAAAGKREKYSEAYFGFIKFAVEREAIQGLESLLRSSKEILRYLLIEATREEPVISRRAVFTSSRLEGETIKKPTSAPETPGEVSEEDLQKSIDALVN